MELCRYFRRYHPVSRSIIYDNGLIGGHLLESDAERGRADAGKRAKDNSLLFGRVLGLDAVNGSCGSSAVVWLIRV